MTQISKEKLLKLKLDRIFNHFTQQELAKELKITQWELLTKIKDNSFTEKEIIEIDKLFDKAMDIYARI